MQWLRQIFARFRFFETVLAWLGFSCGLLLFIPANYLPDGVNLMPYQLGLWCVMLSSFSYFLGRLFVHLWRVVEGSWQQKVNRRTMENLIHCLDHTEKAILREFVISRKTVLQLPIDEPAVLNLLDNGVLEMVDHQPLPEAHHRFDCMISLAARPLLSYRVLSLPVGNLTEEQLERLKKMRPQFLQPNYDANRTYSGKVFRIRANQASGDERRGQPQSMDMEHHQVAS